MTVEELIAKLGALDPAVAISVVDVSDPSLTYDVADVVTGEDGSVGLQIDLAS